MISPIATITLILASQVPAPDDAASASRAIAAEAVVLRDRESADLTKLAERLATGRADEAALVIAAIEPASPSGRTRFVPLPEVVTAPGKGMANLPVDPPSPIPEEARRIRRASVPALFALANRAAAPGVRHYAMADRLLRSVLDRDPDHAEARRLIGFVPYKGGWATPHAADLLNGGYVPHPTFGWVQADWVGHLDRGELPGEFGRNGKPREWLPAEQADALRQDWAKGWLIRTAPHFEIQTNCSLAEAVAFARRLEDFHDLFFSEFADLIGPESLPLARRFANASMKPVASPKKFSVYYFADKVGYVDFFRTQFRQDESVSLGYYLPPDDARRMRTKPRSFFYRDEANPIEAHATLYHESSHQLLFETARSSIDRNRSNYWIWEGLGTYFETVETQPDGSLLVGGKVGPRMEQARRIATEGKLLPLAEFVLMPKDEFGSLAGFAVYRNYAQAMALTVFLLNAEGGLYREGYLDFVADAYRGRVKPNGLSDRLGVPIEALNDQFQAFLKAGN